MIQHSSFFGRALVAQRLKAVIGQSLADRRKDLAPDQSEALDIVCQSVGQLVDGDANNSQTWAAIAEHAQMVSMRLATDGNT